MSLKSKMYWKNALKLSFFSIIWGQKSIELFDSYKEMPSWVSGDRYLSSDDLLWEHADMLITYYFLLSGMIFLCSGIDVSLKSYTIETYESFLIILGFRGLLCVGIDLVESYFSLLGLIVFLSIYGFLELGDLAFLYNSLSCWSLGRSCFLIRRNRSPLF